MFVVRAPVDLSEDQVLPIDGRKLEQDLKEIKRDLNKALKRKEDYFKKQSN